MHELIFDGSTITLNIAGYDAENIGPGQVFGTLQVTDSSLTGGTFGAYADGTAGSAFALWELAAYVAPIPEPSSLALVGLSGLMLLARRRRA